MPFTAAKLGAVHASVIVVVRIWRGSGSSMPGSGSSRCLACKNEANKWEAHMQQLRWKTAFVTGGSRGIGRGIVLKLAESGIKRIAINYLSNDAAANDTAKKTKDRGAEVILVKGDVGKPEEVKRMFAEVKGDFDGSLDIFVHCARPNPGAWLAPPMEATPEGFRQAFDSASVAMAVACQECVPLMPKGGR